MSTSTSRWQWTKAAAVEGLYWLIYSLLRLPECVCLLLAFSTGSDTAYLTAAGLAIGSSLLLAPLRLGRLRWALHWHNEPEYTPALRLLWGGGRRFGAAVGWRWGLWWRLCAGLLLSCLPAALLWGYGSFVSQQGETALSLLWLALGAIAWLSGTIVVGLRRLRYAAAPLLILQGYSAVLALHLSRHLTRRRTGQLLNFWGDRFGWLALCVLPGAALWVLPRLRRDHTALLLSWLQTEDALLPLLTPARKTS